MISVSPGNLLKMKIIRLHLRHIELEILDGEAFCGASNLGFNKPFMQFWWVLNLRTNALEPRVWVKGEGVLGNISSAIESS